MDLEETKEGVKFSISAVRGRSAHTGDINGVLHIKNGKAYFKQKLARSEDGGLPCEMEFTFIDGHIVNIDEKQWDSLAGQGVSYGGRYYKTGGLKKEGKSK